MPSHDVYGLRMAYQEVGRGDPIVLLHGNPTSSYLWRNVVPYLAPYGRVIAPDLIGMGGSHKLPDAGPGSYRFVEHRHYLDGLLEALGAHERVVLVGHDWGGCLAFDWARRHPDAVRGVAYTETTVRPRKWQQESPDGQAFFLALRSAEGEQMVLQDNAFLDVLSAAVRDGLTPADLARYQQPYETPGEGRRRKLAWAREIPFDGEPADVAELAIAWSRWLQTTQIPKLLASAQPGALIAGDTLDFCRTFPHQEEVRVRAGHFVPEDAPDEFGQALASWLGRLTDPRP